MDTESTFALVAILALGLSLSWLGWLGRSRRIDFAMGGHTPKSSSSESWHAANRRVGDAFLVYGTIAVVASLIGFVVRSNRYVDVLGVGAVLGTLVLLGAIARAVRSIERIGPHERLY